MAKTKKGHIYDPRFGYIKLKEVKTTKKAKKDGKKKKK